MKPLTLKELNDFRNLVYRFRKNQEKLEKLTYPTYIAKRQKISEALREEIAEKQPIIKAYIASEPDEIVRDAMKFRFIDGLYWFQVGMHFPDGYDEECIKKRVFRAIERRLEEWKND